MSNPYSSIALVDISHLFHRRWHAQVRTAEQNEAALSTFHEVKDLVNSHGHVIACVDSPPYKRKTLYSEYKAQRPEASIGLIKQLEWLKARLLSEGIRVAGAEGYEGDDIIATLVAGLRLVCDDIRIIGSDKDLYQLVNQKVRVFRGAHGQRPPELIDAAAVKVKTHGVPPAQIVDWLALLGDTSDNIPGCKGVGEVKAAHILSNYATLERLYDAIERTPLDVSKLFGKAIFTALQEQKGAIMASRALVRLMTDAPIDIADLLEKRAPEPLKPIPGLDEAGYREAEPEDFELAPDSDLPQLPQPAIADDVPPDIAALIVEGPLPPAGPSHLFTDEQVEQLRPCDHKFVGSSRCVKCGWRPSADVLGRVGDRELPRPAAAPYNPEPPPPAGKVTPQKYAAEQFDSKGPAPTEIITVDRSGGSIVQLHAGFMLALEPRNMEQAVWMAKSFESSLLFPKLGRWQAILAVMVMGRELGLSAMTSLMNFDMVEGRPSPKWQLIVAMAIQHPDCEYFEMIESTAEKAIFRTKRRQHSTPKEIGFSLDEARKAGLVKPYSGWDKFSAALCRKMSAVHLVRAVYPDNRAAGLYFPEEMGEREDERAVA